MVDWLKLLHSFPRNPKLRVMARVLRRDKDSTIGVAIRWLIWVDEQTEDGRTGLLPKELDEELGCKKLSEALCACGWALVEDEDGTISAVEFGKHSGETAKRRATEARKKSLQRDAERAKESLMKRDICPDRKGTNVPENAAPEKEKEFISKALSGSPVNMVADGSTGERGSSYADWLAPLVAAHPAGRRWNPNDPLPADAIEAAASAYEADPTAAVHAELLGAYLVDSLHEDRRGVAFFRPKLLRVFFEQLGTVIAEAERWKGERGWMSQAERLAKDARKATEAPAVKAADVMTDEEQAAFFHELREEGKRDE